MSVFLNTHADSFEDILWNDTKLKSSFNYDALVNHFSSKNGEDFHIHINSSNRVKGIGLTVLLDEYGLKTLTDLSKFPSFEIELRSQEGAVTPSINFIESENSFFNVYIGNGINRLSRTTKKSLIMLPIALTHKNANCVHNGLMIFSLEESKVSSFIFQISSETCAYFKFDFISVEESAYKFINKTDKIINKNVNNVEKFFDISDVYNTYQIPINSFADSEYFDKNNVTTFGLIFNDKHYSSGCITRTGMYPICDEILLPSYSLAKSIAGTFTFAILANMDSKFGETPVSIIPECDSKSWKNVNFNHLSDMTSGHYLKRTYDYDESSIAHTKFLFSATSHKDKIKIACNDFPYKTKPGKRFVYRTSDTYILGTGFNTYLNKKNSKSDYFNKILVELHEDLGLSNASKHSLRTFDDTAQAYTGWGMYLLKSDLKKISDFLHKTRLNKDNFSYLNEALNPNQNNSISAIKKYDIFYNNGFWSRKISADRLGCDEDIWIPFMSGFGGITFAFFPNGMSYYYFSDGYKFYWDNALMASHKISSFCK